MTAARVGSYEVVRTLARGGMAVVYLARQPALDREVALKRLDLESRDLTLAQRFVREARLAAALDHPHIVTVFDFFEHEGVPYIAMEYMAGGSLRPYVGHLGLPQVFSVLEGILAGLGHAEGRGISHRDLKPENVLITRGGAVKIADFGIARAYDAITAQLTSTGSTVGTPAYMAPEQAQSEPLGPPTDLYAVGVIAYEMLAGRPPFEGTTPVAVLYRHVHEPPPPLSETAPESPPRLREWVAWLLAKDPGARPAGAAAAWEALEEIAVATLGPYWRRAAAVTAPVSPSPGGPVAADVSTTVDSPPPPPTAAMPPRGEPEPATQVLARPRRRRAALAAGLLAAAAVAVVAVVLVAGGSDPPARAAAAATPYDFDGDGRQELVLGMPRSAPRGDRVLSGVVVVHKGPGTRRSQLITPGDGGLPGPYEAGDRFGWGLASADFDRDGRADIAIGARGRGTVSVIYGTAEGLATGRVQVFTGANTRLPSPRGEFGFRLAADDFDADGYADLVIGAPRGDESDPGTGAIQIVPGSADGLRPRAATTIPAPDATFLRFGSKLRPADVNRDGHVDLVEGAPVAAGDRTGHATFCPGRRGGPTRCAPLGAATGGNTSSLAAGDVDGDGFEDIVQGDAVGGTAGGGEVRVWRGGRRGPASRPVVIDQDTAFVPGMSDAGDAFGAIVDAGRVDGDRFADIVVSAPGEDDGAGAVTTIRGGRDVSARAGNARFDRNAPGVPGDARAGDGFGTGLALLELAGDDRLDLAVVSGGARRLDDAVLVIEGRPGIFAPAETEATPLTELGAQVRPTGILRTRVGRPGDS